MRRVVLKIQVDLPDYTKDWSSASLSEYLSDLFVSGARSCILENRRRCIKSSSGTIKDRELSYYEQDLEIIKSSVFNVVEDYSKSEETNP